jgi:triosephosphate isomerase
MHTRKKLIVGNWKMHLTVGQSSLLVHRLGKHIKAHQALEVVLAPSMLALQPISLEIDRHKFRLAAQNAYHKDEGGFTGEVSFTMLQDLVHYAIIGHSERRIYFNEDLETIQAKVAAAVRNGITPIVCIGETKVERLAGQTKQVLHDQIVTALHELTATEIAEVVIAYEPVWAISTFGGELAKPTDVEVALKYIRFQLEELHGKAIADNVRVLYGGSVDDSTASGYLAVPGCDGFIIGSASLNYHKFSAIVDAAYRMVHS